jgi:hypothetical protein
VDLKCNQPTRLQGGDDVKCPDLLEGLGRSVSRQKMIWTVAFDGTLSAGNNELFLIRPSRRHGETKSTSMSRSVVGMIP